MKTKGMSILVVDDTPNNLRLFSDILQKEGYPVRATTSGKLALDAAKNNPPDLIILDIMMPEMDGFEVCARLKEGAETKEIPIIFISALEDIASKVKAFEAGGVDYITKPVEPKEVIARVRTHLRIKQLEETLLQKNKELEEEIQRGREQEALLIQQSRLAALGELLSNIAHHWRQPLTVLSINVQNIEEMATQSVPDINAVHESASLSMRVLKELSAMIDRFRGFFIATGGRCRFDIGEVVDRALAVIGPEFQRYGIEIVWQKAESCFVEGYPHEYGQVVVDILNNAKEAFTSSKAGGKKVVLSLEALEDGRSKLTIRDNGGGIKEEVMIKIFEPYFTTKFPSAGTGLGLYVSKMIIEKNMGGTLSAANIEENGESWASFEIIV